MIPLQSSGVTDTELVNVSVNELMLSAVHNLRRKSRPEDSYAIRYSARPVVDFPQQAKKRNNFFERAFPCLFPWGRGGIESVHQHGVDFTDHVRWAMRYHDCRFHTHQTFLFVAFGIHQRREALNSTLSYP